MLRIVDKIKQDEKKFYEAFSRLDGFRIKCDLVSHRFHQRVKSPKGGDIHREKEIERESATERESDSREFHAE